MEDVLPWMRKNPSSMCAPAVPQETEAPSPTPCLLASAEGPGQPPKLNFS